MAEANSFAEAENNVDLMTDSAITKVGPARRIEPNSSAGEEVHEHAGTQDSPSVKVKRR